ncbi:hypothetical protein A1O3_10294 [Capronia epimyces CBS 606.96]|uniref:F-box domain-containing protein n=1 Tax=Capronia epimyces CBS 606.96 TaxID=1182542 RepID=W9XJI1_9EURO|nr:uncharacterized protein A1O3_10294 [Capronia epimyces CBS 606.96]EXJ77136.1 hypothetical protein A1O3_10294 [Capronia epimyces CBS 606.96]
MWLASWIPVHTTVSEEPLGLCIINSATRASIPYSTWAKVAFSNPDARFRVTLGRCNDYDNALQTASPYSVCTLAHATSFAYHSGVLSYSTCSSLRILDFNHGRTRTTEKVVTNAFLCKSVSVSRSFQGQEKLDLGSLVSLQVQAFASDIVVLLCDFGLYGQYLLAVNIADAFEPPQQLPDGQRHSRVLLCTRLRSTSKLFVRHDSRYLVLGTHSALGNHDHHEWLLYRYDLRTSRPVSKEPLQLRDFFGSEMGSTVCFTIYHDNFYALTNQTSFESEEVDWTSYYHFICFRLDDPHPDLKVQVIWRRQHLEGPINDSWTDIGFQLDHRSGELLIVECRKEWLDGGSQSVRTYYTQPFHRAVHGELQNGLRHPPNDPLSRTLDAKSNSRWEASWPRADRYVHTETQQGDGDGVKEYIRAKTKWHGYHFNAQTFVDLVTEDASVEGEWRPKERIKLRMVSRHELGPLVPTGTGERFRIRSRMRDKEGEEMQDGEEAFGPSKVSLWPPDDAPQELHDMLCPGGRAGDVKAILGDEGMVYMAGPPREPGSPERALIFVSFDPTFGFEGMTRLDGSAVRQKQRDAPSNAERKRKSVSELRRESAGGSSSEMDPEPASSGRVKRIRDGQGTAELQSPRTWFVKDDDSASAKELDKQTEAQGKQAEPGHERASILPHLSPPVPTLQAWSSSVMRTRSPRTSPSPPVSPSSPSFPSIQQPASSPRTMTVANRPSLASRNLDTWRERAAYTTIKKGFWLR